MKIYRSITNAAKQRNMNIRNFIILILLLPIYLYSNEGPIGAKAVVSNKNILNGNIVELHIRATGKLALFPTVKNIDGIKVLSQDERITNMHVYNNGKLQRECTILTLTFAPKKDMTIPSYKVIIDGKEYQTKPIQLKMKDSTTSNRNKSNIFSLKLKSKKNTVAMGEAFLVTVDLSLQHNFIISKKLQYHRPKFKGFFVEQLDKGKSHNKENYQVTQLRYILTAHSEGNFTLGPAYAKIGLRKKNINGLAHVDKSRKMFQRASNTIPIVVLPQTSASDMVGSFNLNSKINTQKVVRGKPIHLSIKLEGKGDLTHYALPDYTLDGVTIYSDPAKIDITVLHGKIHSSYSKKFTFISEKNFTIPERIFSIYDPQEKKLKTLKIKSFPIEIKDARTTSFIKKTKPPIDNRENTLRERVISIFTHWWVSGFAFLLGGIFFFSLRYLYKNKGKEAIESEALKKLYGHIAKDPQIEEMVHKLYARKKGDKSVKISKRRLEALIKSLESK